MHAKWTSKWTFMASKMPKYSIFVIFSLSQLNFHDFQPGLPPTILENLTSSQRCSKTINKRRHSPRFWGENIIFGLGPQSHVILSKLGAFKPSATSWSEMSANQGLTSGIGPETSGNPGFRVPKRPQNRMVFGTFKTSAFFFFEKKNLRFVIFFEKNKLP